MSNSIWKTPDQKPDVFKPHRILVIYEAHDEPELMFSPQYDTLTDHRYVNRWCYWDEFIAQADKAERLLEIAERQNDILQDHFATLGYYIGKEVMDMSDKIKQLIKGE